MVHEENEFAQHDDDWVACWCCGTMVDETNYTEEVVFPICGDCWAKVSPAGKLWIQLFSQPHKAGGIGLRELFESCRRDADDFKGFRFPWSNEN